MRFAVFGRRPSPQAQRHSSNTSLVGWTWCASEISRFRPPVVLKPRLGAFWAGIPLAGLDRRLGWARAAFPRLHTRLLVGGVWARGRHICADTVWRR